MTENRLAEVGLTEPEISAALELSNWVRLKSEHLTHEQLFHILGASLIALCKVTCRAGMELTLVNYLTAWVRKSLLPGGPSTEEDPGVPPTSAPGSDQLQ